MRKLFHRIQISFSKNFFSFFSENSFFSDFFFSSSTTDLIRKSSTEVLSAKSQARKIGNEKQKTTKTFVPFFSKK